MKLTLTSIKKRILEIDDFKSITIPTKSGEITILDNHESLISALKPGIMTLKINGEEDKVYAVGGGVLETDGTTLSIIADMVEDGTGLDIEEIRKKKEDARGIMERYKEDNKVMDMSHYIELENQFLKESALESLALR